MTYRFRLTLLAFSASSRLFHPFLPKRGLHHGFLKPPLGAHELYTSLPIARQIAQPWILRSHHTEDGPLPHIRKLRAVLRNLALEDYPCMLNRIQIWRVGRVVGNIDIVPCSKSLHYIRSMGPRIILLEYRIAKCDINLPQGRKKVLVKNPPANVRGGGFLW